MNENIVKKSNQRKVVSTTIPMEMYEALDQYRWDNKASISQVILSALELWCNTVGIVYNENRGNEI